MSCGCSGSNAPVVDQADGTYQYDHKAHILRWSHPIINESNASGSMEFKLPHHVDASNLFPVTVSFSSPNTFCPIEVRLLVIVVVVVVKNERELTLFRGRVDCTSDLARYEPASQVLARESLEL
mgnify:CR=1 FL=1